jgi:acyl dehydratase
MRPGDKLPTRTFRITRADLVRYAGASGDFNPIHWNERTATRVGLPGVIAHGMYTMALVGRAVTEWVGDPAAVVEYGVRFSRPVPVPDDDLGAELVVEGAVQEVDDAGRAVLELSATCGGERVLRLAQVIVALARAGTGEPGPAT